MLIFAAVKILYSDSYLTCLRNPLNFKRAQEKNRLVACAVARVRLILCSGS